MGAFNLCETVVTAVCMLLTGTADTVLKAAKFHVLSALYVYSTIRAIDGLWRLSLLG